MLQVVTTATGKVFGPHHAHAKMTYDKVDELRRLRQQFGLTYRALGTLFDIDHKTARNIALGKTWASAPAKVVFRAGADELGCIRSLATEGVGIKKIAYALGATEHSVKLVMQAHGIKGINASPSWRAECKRGHALAGGNLYVTPDGRRQCRACMAIRERRRKSETHAHLSQMENSEGLTICL